MSHAYHPAWLAARTPASLPDAQVMGEWRVKNEELRRYHAAADALRRRFASFEAQQVRVGGQAAPRLPAGGLRLRHACSSLQCRALGDRARSGRAAGHGWRLAPAQHFPVPRP